MPDVALRPMTPAEYDAWVSDAIEQYAADHARVGSRPADAALQMARDEFAQLLPDGPDTVEHHLMVGLVDGEPVGTLWLKIPAADGAKGFVYAVEIVAGKRGRGFGRGIMVAAEGYALQQGAVSLGLHVFGDNTVARALYESLGYETTNVNMAKRLVPAPDA